MISLADISTTNMRRCVDSKNQAINILFSGLAFSFDDHKALSLSIDGGCDVLGFGGFQAISQ
jgi:hypothetical protein